MMRSPGCGSRVSNLKCLWVSLSFIVFIVEGVRPVMVD
jgi:hypothetical protein